MKVILSRKGFDTVNGGQPSPVLPDGTPLSFPIPSEKDVISFGDIKHDNKSYWKYIKQLRPNTKLKQSSRCHLDPDLNANAYPRSKGWKPLFGQHSAALSHLINQNVGVGDLFLFFGWFRHTKWVNQKLKYIGRDFHLIFGYFEVGRVINDFQKIPNYARTHPHCSVEKYGKVNCLYESTDKLSMISTLPGAATLQFDENRVLTKKDSSKSRWHLPAFFKELQISRHSRSSWKNDYFQSVAIGQEFVVEEDERVRNWAKEIIQ